MADGFRVAADDFHAVTMNGQEISFGPFRLLADQRLLLEGDRPVRLGSRAFDILVAANQLLDGLGEANRR